ncbi:hypothetical protein ID854_03320 [Xenorhabdus sp. M]|uniref:Phage abortive infection protein n=1 Tax=Xenorhabdus szentirmaii TaxID=290112 RepID=A0AAW3YQ73_9GAMM|nr:hypothetical protein [Xenorhabdus sp. M]MBD2799516.1 hypothetical protein [Xenorhabdus sp. M]
MSSERSIFCLFIIFMFFIIPFSIFLIKGKLHLDEERLDKQGLFWFATITPIVLFFIFGYLIWSNYTLRLDENGLNTFFEISKFPLSILALSPVLGLIVSNIHRTIQTNAQIKRTEEQIRLTSMKNNMDAFYAHYKYIIEGLSEINIHNHYHYDNFKFNNIKFKDNYLNKFKIDEEIVIKNTRKLFNDIYKRHGDLKYGFNPKLNKKFMSLMFNNIDGMTNVLNSFEFTLLATGNKVKMNLNESFDYVDFFERLKVQFESIKRIIHIHDFLSIDYFYDLLKSKEYEILFNNNGFYISDADYNKSLLLFIIFCEMTNKNIMSISDVIVKISNLIYSDPIYDVSSDCDKIIRMNDKISSWSESCFCSVPTYFYIECIFLKT